MKNPWFERTADASAFVIPKDVEEQRRFIKRQMFVYRFADEVTLDLAKGLPILYLNPKMDMGEARRLVHLLSAKRIVYGVGTFARGAEETRHPAHIKAVLRALGETPERAKRAVKTVYAAWKSGYSLNFLTD